MWPPCRPRDSQESSLLILPRSSLLVEDQDNGFGVTMGIGIKTEGSEVFFSCLQAKKWACHNCRMPKKISGSLAREAGHHESWYSRQDELHVCTSSLNSHRGDRGVGLSRCCTHSGLACQSRSPGQTKQNLWKGSVSKLAQPFPQRQIMPLLSWRVRRKRLSLSF